jgi:site-specific DNA recombinase
MRRKSQNRQSFNDPSSVVLYIRVSSDRQVDNTSLDSQERACRAYCEAKGWKIARLFREEGASAKTAERPRFQEMLRYCKESSPRPSFVVVYAVDRFARDTCDHHIVKRHLASLGILLRSATQPLGESPAEALMEGLLSQFAQFDNAVRAERSSNGMKARLQSGSWTFKSPIGYLNGRSSAGKTLVPDPERAPFVRAAFERFATGLHSKGEVREYVHDMGLRTRSGTKVPTETFRRMLENPIYAGIIAVDSWAQEHAANFPALVDRGTFSRVQAILAGKQPHIVANQRNHPAFPLRAFVRCAACNRPLTASFSTGRHGVKYPYYRCQTDDCIARVNIRQEDMHREFLDFVATLTPRPKLVKMFRETVESVWVDRYRETASQLAKLQDGLADLRKRRGKLYQAHIDGQLPNDVFMELREANKAELQDEESKLESARMDEIRIEEVLDFCERLLCDVPMIWRDCSIDQQQRLQQILFPEGITYDAESGYGTTTTCMFFSLLRGDSEGKNGLVALTGIEPVSQP